MHSKNHVQKSAVESSKRAAFIVMAALTLALPLHSQQTANEASTGASGSANHQVSTATPQTDQEIVQELAAMKKRIAELEAKLDHTNPQPVPVDSAKAIEPASSVPASLAAVSEHSPAAKPEKRRPLHMPTGPG